ncbi:MAG: 1-acyl-sn-glycerol-3-phosphate acyltransferase [Bacteroidales bacterium]|nr:1-acyl-sn-glycerol-3-phosphate acyltransferase [Bacteroidales bacterium]
MAKIAKTSLLYKVIYVWQVFFQKYIYYHRLYVIRKTPFPEKGKQFLMASNHQNSLNDALLMVASMQCRKVWYMTRASVFSNWFFKKVLDFLGLLPVYRVRDGHANVKKNIEMFDMAEEKILNGMPVAVFPEAMHQNRHYLGTFYLSYTRIAFETAAKNNFQEEVFIQPVANHYSGYLGYQNDALITYGEFISLKPYYDLYQSNPREAQNIVNDIVKEKVREMMLDIQEIDHYQEIYDLLGNVGVDYAIYKQVDASRLPDKLAIDQQIVAKLDAVKEQNVDMFSEICQKSKAYSQQLGSMHITDDCVREKYSSLKCIFVTLLMLLMLPLFLIGAVHYIIPYIIPKFVHRNYKDILMKPSIEIGLALLVTIPLFQIIYYVGYFILFHNWWLPLLIVLVLPLFAIVSLRWFKQIQKLANAIKTNIVKCRNKEQFSQLLTTRDNLKSSLFDMMQ